MLLQKIQDRMDKELLELLRQDDSEAFEMTYRKYSNRLYGHAFKMLKLFVRISFRGFSASFGQSGIPGYSDT